MKARTFALMIVAVLIGAMAAAGMASDIDNCCFVDRQCSTDQDWVNGYHAFQNNQCSAPAQSQPAGGAPAQIDNCCYVDRQCHSEQDWINGWQAYANNQCGATTQAGAPSSYQQASGVIQRTASGIVYGYNSGRGILPTTRPFLDPATGLSTFRGGSGNCCDIGWQCNNDQDWAEGFRHYQTHRRCGSLPGLISIVGDPDFIDFYVGRLEELRIRLPHRYDYVLNGLNRIEQVRALERFGQADPFFRSFDVSWEGPLVDGWEKRRSAVLVHEACHIHRTDAGYSQNVCDREAWIREELFCREMELQVVIELDTEPGVIEWVRGMVEATRSGDMYWRPERICD